MTESTRVVLPGGYADVVMQQIKPQVGSSPALYVLRSTGVWTALGYLHAPNARRTVAQYIQWNHAILTPAAAWVCLVGIHKSANTGTLSGTDHCGAAPAVGGVAVPDAPGYSQTLRYPDPEWLAGHRLAGRHAGRLDGAALRLERHRLGRQHRSGLHPAARRVEHDLVLRRDVPGDQGGQRGRGSAFTLPAGQGLLIVTGDLNIVASTDWSGLILVGGNLTTTGSATVYGAIYSGLNITLGSNPDSVAAAIGPADVSSTAQLYRYDSCALANALSRFAGLQLVRNAWTDNWMTW